MGLRGLACPGGRTYNTTPCAYLGLWVLITSRGRGRERGRRHYYEGARFKVVKVRLIILECKVLELMGGGCDCPSGGVEMRSGSECWMISE